MPMTIEQFYEELQARTQTEGVSWYLNAGACIRTRFRGRVCCPITFLGSARSGRDPRPTMWWPSVANHLELDEWDARAIVRAADTFHDEPIRSKLIELLKLK